MEGSREVAEEEGEESGRGRRWLGRRGKGQGGERRRGEGRREEGVRSMVIAGYCV